MGKKLASKRLARSAGLGKRPVQRKARAGGTRCFMVKRKRLFSGFPKEKEGVYPAAQKVLSILSCPRIRMENNRRSFLTCLEYAKILRIARSSEASIFSGLTAGS
jgi:hypothetical protein